MKANSCVPPARDARQVTSSHFKAQARVRAAPARHVTEHQVTGATRWTTTHLAPLRVERVIDDARRVRLAAEPYHRVRIRLVEDVGVEQARRLAQVDGEHARLARGHRVVGADPQVLLHDVRSL